MPEANAPDALSELQQRVKARGYEEPHETLARILSEQAAALQGEIAGLQSQLDKLRNLVQRIADAQGKAA